MALSRRALLLAPLAALAPRRVLVVAHRGHHTKLPENSLAGYESAIAIGCDFIEIDCREDAAGVLVSSHDAPAPPTAPALDEVMRLARGRIGVYFDWKQAPAERVARLLRETAMLEQTLVYGHPDRLREIRAIEAKVRVMPEIMVSELVDRQLEWFRPDTVAYSGRELNNAVIARAKAAGAKVLVDTLGRNDRPEYWQQSIDAGADGLQTDRPEELLAWLRARGA